MQLLLSRLLPETAAIHYAVINICQAGDEIVSANDLYGGSYTMFNNIHPQLGIKVNWVDARDPENFAKAITPKTKALFCETVSNPALNVADLEAIADIAKAHDIPLIVDGTFTTPYLCQPIKHGANFVCNSLTKWLGGHGTGIGGVVADANTFDFSKYGDKFPLYNSPEGSYGGLKFSDVAGMGLPPFIIRMRIVPLRNLGACISADNAWMFMQGIETLHLRMQRQCENALAVAKHLKDNPNVEWVRYPGLEDDPQYANTQKYMRDGMGGGMVVFGIKGGLEAGKNFIEGLDLFSHVANVGDAKSLAIHPSSTTHSQLDEEQQVSGGITPELVRLSVGIEHIDDILEDIDKGLAASK